jgi:apolipoprotein N-acyltransferase
VTFRWRLLLGALSGALLSLAFPPVGASLVAPVAVGLLALAVYKAPGGQAAVAGAIQGAVTFALLIRWMTLIGTDAWLLLVGVCAAWMALMAWAQSRTSRLPWWPLWFATLWVAQEALRDRIPIGGFPWGRLAFGQTATTLTPWAAIAGAPAVTFVTALAGALLAYATLAILRRQLQWTLAALGGVVIVALAGLLIPRPGAGEGSTPTATVAVIQGGVPTVGLGQNDDRRAVLDRHVRRTLDLATAVSRGEEPQPDAVMWPENAVDIDPYVNPDVAATLTATSRAINAPILIGAVIDAPGDPTMAANVGIVWTPEGPQDMYIKRRPVPFGEYVPLRSVLASLIGRFDRVPRDFIGGNEPGVLDVGQVRIGDVICFEVAYDEVVRDAVVAGGRALVVQTNNATYAGLGQPEQQATMSRLRAVEHGRTVLVAATSGISAIIAPDGAILGEIPEGETGYLVAEIPLRDSRTVADWLGAWPEWICAIVAALAVGMTFRRGDESGPAAHSEAPPPLSAG